MSSGVVNYRLSGPENAPLVACVHGLNASLASFVALQAALQDRGLRVLSYDLYGFGLSTSPGGQLGPELYVQQLVELIDHVQGKASGDLAPPRVHVVGFCLGGLVATEFALRWPARVARLLLIAPAGLGPRAEAPCKLCLFSCLRKRVRGSLLVAAATCLAWSCTRPARCYLQGRELDMCTPDVRDPESAEATAAAQTITERFSWAWPRSANSFLRGLRDMPIWREDFEDSMARLAASRVPVLFIWGTEDGVMPYEEAQDAVERLFGPTDASCIFLEGAGHGLLYEPQDIAEVAYCAQSWFTESNDPNWLSTLQASSLRADVAEPCPPQFLGAEAAS